MLRISQIKRNAEKGEQGLKHAAAKELRIREEENQKTSGTFGRTGASLPDYQKIH
jgi:hypothetical protein